MAGLSSSKKSFGSEGSLRIDIRLVRRLVRRLVLLSCPIISCGNVIETASKDPSLPWMSGLTAAKHAVSSRLVIETCTREEDPQQSVPLSVI